jgi:hypothetical protein
MEDVVTDIKNINENFSNERLLTIIVPNDDAVIQTLA